VALALPVVVAVLLGTLLGGSLRGLSQLRFRASWLLFAAVGLQVAAFPFGFLPWHTGQDAGTALWLGSYGLLVVAALLNARIPGVLVLAAGMGANLLAVAVNGGTMPVLPGAMHAAGRTEVLHANSTAASDPALSWLVDRWSAPDWVPLANVFSLGDVVIAVGAMVMVVAGMGVGRPLARRQALS
jgi:hypothetical protein